MKHYSKSLDLLIAAQQFGLKGKAKEAAKLFNRALAQKDLKPTLAALEALQAANYAAAQTAKANKPRVTDIIKAKAVAKAKKVEAAEDDFNSVIDNMTGDEEAGIEDIMELPTAGTDNGQGESSEDVGMDDASDLDFSPSEELSDGDLDGMDDFADDLEGLDDLGDLSDEDFGIEDFGDDSMGSEDGADVFANTTGEGDVDTREPATEDPNDIPEGEPAKDIGKPPAAEDTTVTSSSKPAGVAKLNRTHANLAALRKMQPLTTAARVAAPKQKK